jgi:hypothetical protein
MKRKALRDFTQPHDAWISKKACPNQKAVRFPANGHAFEAHAPRPGLRSQADVGFASSNGADDIAMGGQNDGVRMHSIRIDALAA